MTSKHHSEVTKADMIGPWKEGKEFTIGLKVIDAALVTELFQAMYSDENPELTLIAGCQVLHIDKDDQYHLNKANQLELNQLMAEFGQKASAIIDRQELPKKEPEPKYHEQPCRTECGRVTYEVLKDRIIIYVVPKVFSQEFDLSDILAPLFPLDDYHVQVYSNDYANLEWEMEGDGQSKFTIHSKLTFSRLVLTIIN